MDAYSTHTPLLRAIGQAYPVRRVLELGAGLYSTPLFLDRDVFPLVEMVDSCEDDLKWFAEIGYQHRLDDRYTMHYALSADTIAFHPYDLIFVDNGHSRPERVATLQIVNERKAPNNLIVVHDYEQTDYQGIIDMPNLFVYDALTPHTAVYWDKASLDIERLKAHV